MRSLLPNKQSNYYQKCKTTNHHYKPLVVNAIYNNTHLILVKKKTPEKIRSFKYIKSQKLCVILFFN